MAMHNVHAWPVSSDVSMAGVNGHGAEISARPSLACGFC